MHYRCHQKLNWVFFEKPKFSLPLLVEYVPQTRPSLEYALPIVTFDVVWKNDLKKSFFQNQKSRFFDSHARQEHQISGARVIRTNIKSRQNIDHMKSARDE